MFLIGQSLKHIHMTYYFLDFQIFFWLTPADIYCLEFIFQHIKEMLYVNKNLKGNKNNHEIKTKIFTCFPFSFSPDIDVKNPFFNVKLKFLMNNFQFFSV